MEAATTTVATDKAVRKRTFTTEQYNRPIDCECF